MKPTPGFSQQPEMTSAAHVVRVRKGGGWGENVTFCLIADGSVIGSVQRYIP